MLTLSGRRVKKTLVASVLGVENGSQNVAKKQNMFRVMADARYIVRHRAISWVAELYGRLVCVSGFAPCQPNPRPLSLLINTYINLFCSTIVREPDASQEGRVWHFACCGKKACAGLHSTVTCCVLELYSFPKSTVILLSNYPTAYSRRTIRVTAQR